MSNRVRIVVTSREVQVLRDLIRGGELDVSCGGTKKQPSGEWTLEAYVSPETEARLQTEGYHIEIDRSAAERADGPSRRGGEG